jgi:hypothetical protein
MAELLQSAQSKLEVLYHPSLGGSSGWPRRIEGFDHIGRTVPCERK